MLINVFVDVGVDISLDIGMDVGIDDADSLGTVSCCQCCFCGLVVGVEYSHNTVMVQLLL